MLLVTVLSLASAEHAPMGQVFGRGLLPKPVPEECDPNREDCLHALVVTAREQAELARRQEATWKAQRKEWKTATPLEEMRPADLQQYHWQPASHISKKERRGWELLAAFAEEALQCDQQNDRKERIRLICETSRAIANNRRSPAPPSLDFFQLPLVILDYHHNPIARGATPAANLEAPAPGDDVSRLNPAQSSFWSPPREISSQNLYFGFGRSALPRWEDKVCIYDKPKTSYGGNPGFEVICEGVPFKVKFAETISEPFTARMFHALGYHVDPTDHAPFLKIQYSRRLFREFHLRQPVNTRLRLASIIPLHTIKLQRRFDPFDFIAEAVLKDGRRISGPELKQMIFRDPSRPHPEDDPDNLITEAEARIHYLVTVPANIQPEDVAKSIGPWEFEGLGHEDLRELRAAGLLGAWTGWFDSRWENTRLRIVETKRGLELRHFFTDLGGGLGRAVGPTSRQCEEPNLFPWGFTRPPKVQGPGKMTIPFRIVHYQPIEDTMAFKEMTLDDARWMARMIAQLSEEQILQALVAAGADSAHARLFCEKLVSRRDRMIRDLGLADEIALLLPEGVNRQFSYDPATDGPVVITVENGRKITARTSNDVVDRGRLIERQEPGMTVQAGAEVDTPFSDGATSLLEIAPKQPIDDFFK